MEEKVSQDKDLAVSPRKMLYWEVNKDMGQQGTPKSTPRFGQGQRPWDPTLFVPCRASVVQCPLQSCRCSRRQELKHQSLYLNGKKQQHPNKVEKQWEHRLVPGPGPAGASALTQLQKYNPTTASKKHRPRYCTEPLPSGGRATNTPSFFTKI